MGAAVIGALVGLVGSLIGVGVQAHNYKKQQDVAQENFDLQKENLEYNKEVQERIFEREDNAYQRARADLEKAGYNPNIINGGAGAGSVVATQAPQRQQVSSGGLADAIKHMSEPINDYISTKKSEISSKLMNEQVSSQTEQNKQMKIKTATQLLDFAKENGLSADINYLEGIPYVTVGTKSKPYQSGYELEMAQRNAELAKTTLSMDIDTQRLELDKINSKISQEKNDNERQKLKQQAIQAQNDIDYKYKLMDFNQEIDKLRVNNQISVDALKKLLIQEQIEASKNDRRLKTFNSIFGATMQALGLSLDVVKNKSTLGKMSNFAEYVNGGF